LTNSDEIRHANPCEDRRVLRFTQKMSGMPYPKGAQPHRPQFLGHPTYANIGMTESYQILQDD